MCTGAGREEDHEHCSCISFTYKILIFNFVHSFGLTDQLFWPLLEQLILGNLSLKGDMGGIT